MDIDRFPPLLAFSVSTPVAASLAAGAAVVGIALVIWGRIAGRGMFTLLGGAVGWWAGEIVAHRLGANVFAGQIVCAVAAAMLAFVLTPLLWALLAAAIAGGVAVYFSHLSGQTDLIAKFPDPGQAAGLASYATAATDHLLKVLKPVWEARSFRLCIVGGLTAAVPLLVGALRLRLAAIVMSSLVGGSAVAAGVACTVGLLAPSAAPILWERWYVVGGVAAAMAVIGVIVQYRRALKADKQQKNREGEPPEKKAGTEEKQASVT